MGDEKLIEDGICDSNLSDNSEKSQIPKEQEQHITDHSEHHRYGEHSHHSEHRHHGEHSHHDEHHHHSEHSHHDEHHHHSEHRHHGEHSHQGEHRHHSGHSHRSGHSHHYRAKRKKHTSSSKKGFWSTIKGLFDTPEKKKKASIICAFALGVVLLFAISLDIVLAIRTNPNVDNQTSGTANNTVLSVEVVNPDGVLVNNSVVSYMKVNLIDNPNVIIRNFAASGERVDEQKPVALNLAVNGATTYSYKIELADNPDFKNASVDYLDSNRGTYVFEHLYVNTGYYYRVTAYTINGTIVKNGHFRTADTPRILSIDGIYNVRDIGNWKTDSGKRIKQGLLIRGTELDGAVENIYSITDKGIVDMLEIYGIKFDMDLRNAAETPLGKDSLGANVEHKYYASPAYHEIFTDDGKSTVKAIFKDLANLNNYPMYLHCTYGADRTGTICYLLEAVLGVSRGDCLKDYGLTYSFNDISNILVVENGLKAYDEYGTMSLKEQAEIYLISCGITMTEINTIREIFLGE